MYEPIIGLEVHLQPKTNSKMFCACSADYFGRNPNTLTCPVCLGLPGALPVPNEEAIRKCIKLALAFNCSINRESKFDRKNYFYPDLPKGYQISQYDLPFGYEGFFEISVEGDSRRIRITRVHMEEDTGKSMHSGEKTLLDFNKSGLPLIEIVTEPDFVDVKEVLSFAKSLRQVVRYLEISDADMEKGQMRFELNMSIREVGSKGLPDFKVEIKNIGSISVLEKVIEYELKRQGDILDKGEKPVQETRGIRDMSGKTYSQRTKENSEDYRYFPEPDIPPIEISAEEINAISDTIGEMPNEKVTRYIEDYGLEPASAETTSVSREKAEWFELAVDEIEDRKIISEVNKLYVGDVFSLLKADKKNVDTLRFTPRALTELAKMILNGELSRSLGKQVLAEMYKTGKSPEEIKKEKGLEVVDDEEKLFEIIEKVISENKKVVADISKNPNAIKFLIGKVMQATKGQADVEKVKNILDGKLL